MFGGEEIILSGKYKDFKLGVRFDLKGKNESDVANVLGFLSSEIEPYAFRFSGIDTEAIEKYTDIKGKGLSSVSDFLESNSSAWTKMIKENLSKLNPKLLPSAESYFFNQLLTKAGVAFKAPAEAPVEPEKEELEGQIGFIGKFGKWIAVKKLGLEDAKDYEVSGILSGINHTAVNKGFDFSGVKKNDDLVSKVTTRKRKSYGNAVLMLRELEESLDGDSGDAYVVCKSLEMLGFRPYASPGMLTEAHPDIKPPKVRGRKPKG